MPKAALEAARARGAALKLHRAVRYALDGDDAEIVAAP
jgi:hypothetical protein